MLHHIRRVKVGDLITEGLMNDIIDVANQCNLSVGGSLNMTSGPDGYTISAVVPQPIWGKITGAISSGKYPFTQQFPESGGTWSNGNLADEAFEQNGSTSVPTGKVVRLERTGAGEWVFEYGAC